MGWADILKLATAISLLTPLFIAALKWLQDRAKRRDKTPQSTAAAADVVQGMTLRLLEPLQGQVDDLRQQVQAMQDTVRDLNQEVELERTKRRKAEDERDDAYDVLQHHKLPLPPPRP